MTTTLRDRSAGHAGSVRSGTGGGRSRPARLRRRARRAARRMLREVPAAIWLLALVSGIGGALAGCAPVGGPLADRLVTAAFAAVVVLLASQATWPPLLLATGIVAAASPNPALRTVGVAGVVACVVLERSRRLEPSGAALLGLLAVQGLLRLGPLGPERASALVTAIAVVPLAISGLRHAPRRLRRPVVALLVAVAVGLVAAVAVTAYATDRARTALAAAEDEVLAGLDAAKAGDREEAAERFRAASIRFGQAQDQTGGWWSWPARQAPAVGHQLRTLDLVASSGRAATDLAYDSAARVDPDRLRMVDGRLDLDAIRSYQPVFDEIAGRTAAVRRHLDGDASPWLVQPIDEGLTDFRATVAEADDSATTAATAARLAPQLLGGDGVRRYLVAMVTPAEARASGGFMGNYAVLTAEDGRLTLGEVGRKEDLNRAGDPATKAITGPPDYIAAYGRYDPARTWENVTMSPDFPSVAQAMAELFPQSGGVPVDGVLRIDPLALQGLLALTGPVALPDLPRPLDETNAADFLLREQYAIYDDQAQRIDLLGDLAEATFDRFTTGRGARPAVVARELSPALRVGSLAFWFRDADEQAFVEDLGFAASVPAVRGGDSFGVTTQNAGASKIDVFLQRTVDYRAEVDAATGDVNASAEVVLRNDAPAEGLPFYVIGNLVGLPSGTNRSFVSIYSPLDLEGATLDGAPLELVAEDELGRHAYRTFVDIPPGASRTIRVDLTGRVDMTDGRYRFDYVPQVLARPDVVRWSLTASGGALGAGTAHPGNTVTGGSEAAEVRWPVSAGPWRVSVPVTRAGG